MTPDELKAVMREERRRQSKRAVLVVLCLMAVGVAFALFNILTWPV